MKKISCCIAAGVWMVVGVTMLHADSVGDKLGISGIAAAGIPIGDHSVMDHTGSVGHDFGGILRMGLSPNWSAGASYDNINLYGKDGERHHPEMLLGNVFYHLNPDHKLVPTFQLGVGAGSTLTDGAFNKFSTRAGLGVDYFFSPNFSAGPQLTYTYIEHGSGALDEYHVFGAGLMVNLYIDKPHEKKPSAETSTLAPAIMPVATAAPAPVAAPVMEKPIEQKVMIELRVLFDSGKSVVKPIYHDDIRRVAEFMDTHAQSKAEIEGHTDSTGPAAMNKRLSQQRADAVREYLIKEFNMDPSRITAVGYGEVGPIADNSTREGREKNRRVVATLEAIQLVHPNQ